jgi:hypothetical protein
VNKRLILAGLAALPFLAIGAQAETKTGTYTVPKGVKKIRVRSTVGDKEVLDTNFRVVPGQKFIIDAIEE